MKYSLAATTFLLLGSTAAAFQSPSPHTRIPRSTQITPQPLSHQHTTSTTTSTTALSAAPLAVAASSLSGITAPIGSISVLAFVILIHEGGHFLAARSQGIKVQEFSVGVGPKLFGFTRGGTAKSKKDQEIVDEEDEDQAIEFNLRAIPLGGYVRFPENYNATLEYQIEVEADKKRAEIQSIIEENRDATGNSNGLLSSINILANQKKREEERIAALETMALQMTSQEPTSSQPWWQKNPFASKSKAKDAEEEKKKSIIINEDGTVSTPPIDYYDDVDLLQNRPPLQRALVLVGGVVFNILLAFTLYFGELTVGNGLQKPIFSSGAVISTAPRVNSASVGLLDKGDVILALNGNPISSDSPTMYTGQQSITKFIENIRATEPGQDLHLSVLKYNTQTPTNVDIKPLRLDAKDSSSPLSIGVNIAPNYVGKQMVKASNPIDAAVLAGTEVTELTSQTARSIFSFLGGLLVSGGKTPAGSSLSGPIGVLKTGSDVVATNDVAAVIGFAAAISVNLAVVNALPLPALDGGQLVFVIAELLTGKKVDQRKQENISSAALLFLLLVSAGTAVGDITSLVK